MDTRSVYTAVCTARIANILTPELVGGAAEYLLRCQTYEGGFGGEPGNEAHGGYTFCALAGLILLGRAHECNLPALQVRTHSRTRAGIHILLALWARYSPAHCAAV